MRNVPVLALVAVSMLSAGVAQATPVSFHFGGNLTSVDAALSSQFAVGDAIAIDLAFDTATPDLLSDPSRAAYAYTNFTMQFGTYIASFPYGLTSDSALDVLNNFNTDYDGFGPSSFTPGTGVAVNGFPLSLSFLGLLDFTKTAFSGIALPTSLDLTGFQTRTAEGTGLLALAWRPRLRVRFVPAGWRDRASARRIAAGATG